MIYDFSVLLTLDLPEVDKNTRDKFNECLEKKGFTKIEGLTTTYCFKDKNFERSFYQDIKSAISFAKKQSKVQKVRYAFLVSTHNLELSNV